MILPCTCTIGPNGIKMAVEYQDAAYGQGNRVHTPMVKKDPPYFRCTICRTERSAESPKAKKAREAEAKKSGEKLAKSKS